MVIKKYCYECPKCGEWYFFEVGKYYSKICPTCDIEMKLIDTYDCDTELAEKAKNTPSYDPTQDPNSKFYIPVIKCPYCLSTNTSKISAMSRVASTGLFGLGSKKMGKQWHCNKCNSDF